MLGLALSILFPILFWRNFSFLSLVVPAVGVYFWLRNKKERYETFFLITLVFLLVLGVLGSTKGVGYGLATTYLFAALPVLLVLDLLEKKKSALFFNFLFWCLVGLGLWEVARVKYPKLAFLVFFAVGGLFLRDLFRRGENGRTVCPLTDEGPVDGRGQVQKVVGSGTRGDESLRGVGDVSARRHGEDKEQGEDRR